MALFRETGDQWALTHPLCDLALRTWDAGRLHEAVALIQEYLAIFRQLRAPNGVSMALGYLSYMAVSMGDFAAATRAAQEKAEIEGSRGLPIGRAYGLHVGADLHFAQGNLAQARAQWQEALALARGSPNQGFVAAILYHLGQVALYTDRLDEAAERLAESRRLSRGTDRWWLEAEALFAQGQVAARRHEYIDALALMQESLTLYQEVRPKIPVRLEGLAQVWQDLHRPERAVTLLGAASQLRGAMGLPLLPVDKPGYEQVLASVRASLTDAAFAAAWAAGESLSAEESVAGALAESQGLVVVAGTD